MCNYAAHVIAHKALKKAIIQKQKDRHPEESGSQPDSENLPDDQPEFSVRCLECYNKLLCLMNSMHSVEPPQVTSNASVKGAMGKRKGSL